MAVRPLLCRLGDINSFHPNRQAFRLGWVATQIPLESTVSRVRISALNFCVCKLISMLMKMLCALLEQLSYWRPFLTKTGVGDLADRVFIHTYKMREAVLTSS